MSDHVSESHESLLQFLYQAPIGLVRTSLDGTVEMINPMSAQLLLPLAPGGNLDNLFDVLDPFVPQLRGMVASFEEASGVICEATRFAGSPRRDANVPERRAASSDASNNAESRSGSHSSGVDVLSVSVLKLDGDSLIAVLVDATSDVRREEQGMTRRLRAAAKTDVLTSMPNRAAVLERLQALRDEDSLEFAVLFINADRFSQINDTFGRPVGDQVLGLMADRLRSALRAQDLLSRPGRPEPMAARVGGDEFVVVLEGLRCADDIHAVSRRLIDLLTQPYGVGTHQIHCGVSVGVVLRAQADPTPDVLLQHASLAMTEAKKAGGSRHVMFTPSMAEVAARRGTVENDLRRALAEDQLFVVYQPVVGLSRGEPGIDKSVGVEALVRWRHPVRGVVPPIEFIGVAEETGLIGALGAFVLARSAQDFMRWQRELGELAPRLLAVNLSKAQLTVPGLVDLVAAVIAESGMSAAQLQLEVTESLAAQDDNVQARLHELKALGLTLALDDFGTGYSSLASLHQLPVDTVKIDRSFTSQGDTSHHHRVLMEATVRVAASLGMGTVAEGIETAAQAAVVRDLGCQKGQGYLYSKPLTSDDLMRWLAG